MYLQGTFKLKPRQSDKGMLEPYVVKATRTVLRGGRNGNIPDLPDVKEEWKNYSTCSITSPE